MKTILKSDVFENSVLIKTHTKDFETKIYEESKIVVDNEFAKGTTTEIKLNGVRIIIRDIKTKNHTIAVQHDFPFFKLQFEIEGSSHYKPLNKLSKEVYIPNKHYNLFYLPEVNGILNYETKYRKTLEILFTENYIKKIIGSNYKNIFHKFGEAITNKESFLMWKKSKPISQVLQNHINDIINCKYPNGLKKPYLKAKINELLIFLLEKTNDIDTTKANENLSDYDYNNILKIETYIKSNLKNTLTIPELAIIAGMNTSKLKHDFKIVFNTTIFKYITQLRMEKAKHLIVSESYTIAEASYKVGYKHSQHFTAAFKKLYGFLPSKLT